MEAEFTTICKPRLVNQVLSTTLSGDTPEQLRLTLRTNARARKKLEDTLFGKRIPFANRDNWPTADLVTACRAQSEVESGFRQMMFNVARTPRCNATAKSLAWAPERREAWSATEFVDPGGVR